MVLHVWGGGLLLQCHLTMVCSHPQTGALIVTPTRELATQIAGVLRVLLPPSLSLAVLIGGSDPQRDTQLLKTQG